MGYSEDTVRVHWGTVRVQLGHSGIRREEERVRMRREGGYIEGTGRIQWGYSEDTVRVHWGTVRVQLRYSGIRREEERVRRRREGGYIEDTGRIH